MKKIKGSNVVLMIFSVMLLLTGCQNTKEEQMRHIVVFKYKPDATEEQIEKVTKAFGDLKDKIPGIVSFEHGINDSPENKNLGFTHVYLLTFEDAQARDTYLPHPEHKKFGQLLGELGILEDAFVVDYTPVE
ncbi:stress responsive alpha-beta barrel domain-containing protein [Flammeovirgaceae bacterium 311]|nr:stress responsive alpha-beta barrel domain-containing protein [Flammeovirgaceae bacterium 311]